MPTQIGICNSALIKIGAERINALTDANKRAIYCNEQYAKIRDEVLSAHPWNFAQKRATLAPLAAAPAWGYTAAFQLPDDCLTVRGLDDSTIHFHVEGRQILCNETTLNVIYTSQVTDESQFDPAFSEAFSCRLAAELSYLISNSNPVQQTMMQAYQAVLREARLRNAQGRGTAQHITADGWLRSRF